MTSQTRARAASSSKALPPITVTDRDRERLLRCIERASAGRSVEAAEALEAEIFRARVVASEQVPDDVVTMNSRVVFEDVRAGARRAITLAYPADADADAGRVSVLAPIGSALLGLRVGDEIDWDLPGGRTATLRVVEVTFQPEAAGRFDL